MWTVKTLCWACYLYFPLFALMQKVEPKNQGFEFLWVRGYCSISIINSVRTLFCTFWVSVFIGDPSDSSKTTKISAVGKPQNSMPLLFFCVLGLVGLKIFIIWFYTSCIEWRKDNSTGSVKVENWAHYFPLFALMQKVE